MKAVFADTFFWIAITNVQDQAHEQVRMLARSLQPRTICTSEDILTEYLNYFAGWGAHFRRKASLNVQSILDDPAIRVFSQSSSAFAKGLTLYRARFDKGYSLTDCVSMQTMLDEQIWDVLTNDVHFEQEGFNILLKKPKP